MFENSSIYPEIGDYVKFLPISNFYDGNLKDEIFKIVLNDVFDGHNFLTIYSELLDFKLSFIPKYTVRHLTDEERKELELKLSIKKYNL
jgi:hypothetical protein